MQEIINDIINNIISFIMAVPPIVAFFLGIMMIVLESMIPVLPLGVFIALNILIFGNLRGFFMSWFATIIGCIFMFGIVRILFEKQINKGIEKNNKINTIMKKIDNIQFSNLVIITALPFTPAFLINIGCGLSKMSLKKFLVNVLIAKTIIVYFWGYIGTTFIQSLTNYKVLIELSILLIFAYALSKIVMKKNKLE